MSLNTASILGAKLAVIDYENAFAEILRLGKENKPSAVAAANTHLVTEARRNLNFKNILNQFDLIVPDGMPLIWSMRLKGKQINDRVYGPYLMEYVLKRTPKPWKHFFFGGTQETLRHLCDACRVLQPDLEIAGTLSPPFRPWNELDEEHFAHAIREKNPDFIWVALGGEKQEKWIIENQFRHDRSVFLAVGDAFNLLSGQRAFAPSWMQKAGLTWLYRLIQEPKRMAKRYLKYNTLFIYYTLRDALFGSEVTS